MATTTTASSADRGGFGRLTAVVARAVGYLIYAYLVVVEIVLSLGFLLLLFGANSSAGFVRWVYRSLDRAMRPFRGIFEPIELGTTNNDVPAVFDTSILFAMIIYGIVAIALHSALDWLTARIARIDREHELRAQEAAYQAALRHQAMVGASAARQGAAAAPSTGPTPAAAGGPPPAGPGDAPPPPRPAP